MPTASFGELLPDQLPTIASTISAHLNLENDLSSFLAERAAVEKEYASKLAALTRKYREKKTKRDQEAAIGPNPQKEYQGQQNTISTFVADLFATTESASSDHVNLATNLERVANEMASSGRKRDEIRKKHTSYANKLLSDRDKIYAERQKAKNKYDELCHEVEAHRQKREKAEDNDKHADRAAKGFQIAQVDMWNGKNMYLIQIAVSNRAKQKFYREDLPAVENSLQSLWTLTTHRLASSLAKANVIVAFHHEQLGNRFKQLEQSKDRVNTDADQQLFIEYNQQRWQEPDEWSFEPCSSFFDQPNMSTEPDPTVFLQNRLIRSRTRLAEVDPLAEVKRREVDGLQNLKDAYEKQQGLGDPDDVMDNLFESMKAVFGFEIEIYLLEAEIDTIVAAIGEDQGQAKPHRFKPASFTIPTSCNFCKGTIWGIAKQGLVCKPCGYTVHVKCEMKVPAECRASPGDASGSLTSRTSISRRSLGRTLSTASSARNSKKSTVDYGTANSIPESTSTEAVGNLVGRIIYGFEATSPFELSVPEGEMVELVEDDMDNCGWIKVKKSGKQGLVPTSYVDFDNTPGAAAGGPSVTLAAPSQGCGKFVKALYEYAAQDPEELSLSEGERVELTVTGFGYGEGWCEGVKAGKVGIFPSNYVQSG